MSNSASFTGSNSVRYPAPDVARGFMLLLIAVANAPFWMGLFPEPVPSSGSDRWWLLIRELLVDHRAYPLFALLFGFGLMTMVIRRREARIRARSAELDARIPGLPEEIRAGWVCAFEGEADDDARRLVRRRGWWMLLFGFVHAIVFAGDIIGAYALIAVLFAGLIAKRRFRILAAIAAVQIVLMSAVMLVGAAFGDATGLVGDQSAAATAEFADFLLGRYYPLISVAMWAVITIMCVLLSTILPCAVLGAWVATTDLVSRPDRHRGLLTALSLGGFALAVLMGLPEALDNAGFSGGGVFVASYLHEISGIFGAIGWLALLVLLAGPARGSLVGWRRFLASIGKRSMTAYIGQTLLFVAAFATLGSCGVRGLRAIWGPVIGLAVWALLALFCFALESRGYKRGPLEILLRRAVVVSERSHPESVIPVLVGLGGGGAVSSIGRPDVEAPRSLGAPDVEERGSQRS